MGAIIENYAFVFAVALLAIFSRRNGNLHSVILLMMLPMMIDIFFLTPTMQFIKGTDWRHFFFLFHGLNDVLMLVLIGCRGWICTFLTYQFPFRRMFEEKLILAIYAVSVVTNISCFFEFSLFMSGGDTAMFFYNNYDAIKGVLGYSEMGILALLTWQTFKAVKELKAEGLIS